jgi:uncharacterized lipoprotein YehR (DUF1307 family)
MKMSDHAISFIRVIFVLSLMMSITGCAVSRSEQYRDPLAGMNIQSSAPAYPHLVLAVLISENTKNTIEDGRHGRSWKTAEELEQMLEKDIDVYRKNFKAVVRIEKFEDAAASNADLVAVIDWVDAIGDSAKSDKRAIFLTSDKQPIDTIKGQGSEPVGAFAGPGSFRKATERADAAARAQLASALSSSVKLSEFSKSPSGISGTLIAGNQRKTAVHVPGKTTVKSDIDELPLSKAKSNKNAYAMVIGIENYRQKLPKADFATADAKTFTEYLTRVMGYPEENVITLMNEHATYTDLVKYFEKWLPNNVETGSSVFIYFSGHGAPDPKTGGAYLVPYDGDPSFIAETGYSLKRMYDSLEKLPAREIIVALDSCFSGAGGRSVIAKGVRPLVMNLQGSLSLSRNITVLSASSGDQISATYDEKGHGLFTYFLLKGMKDEDVIRQDGSIKMVDLFSYIKPQVERIARKKYNNEQTPQLIGAKK